ncbi:MAG: AAA family ATPase [Chloroflexi bacterium]|nr:AAA family ATPase [Chloroflexota bacterium]
MIFDCPPATKLVTQNAIAASHGFIIPVIPEAVSVRGVPHLITRVMTKIDKKFEGLAQYLPKAMISKSHMYPYPSWLE